MPGTGMKNNLLLTKYKAALLSVFLMKGLRTNMMTKATITIDEEFGQIMLPVEVGQKLNLGNFDWLKVNVLSNHMVLSVTREEIDEEFIKALIHEGILIDPE